MEQLSQIFAVVWIMTAIGYSLATFVAYQMLRNKDDLSAKANILNGWWVFQKNILVEEGKAVLHTCRTLGAINIISGVLWLLSR